MTARRAAPIAALAALAGLLPGLLSACRTDPNRGYSLAPTFDQSIRSIAVPVVRNSTFYVGLERQLTEAVVNEVQRRTPWRVTGLQQADSMLRATITEVRLGALSLSPGTGFVLEQSVTIVVDYDWENSLTGDVLASKRGFAVSSTFVPAQPTGERIDRGLRAALNELASAIVDDLRADW